MPDLIHGAGYLPTVKKGGFEQQAVLNYVDELTGQIKDLKSQLEEAEGKLRNTSAVDVSVLRELEDDKRALQEKLHMTQTMLEKEHQERLKERETLAGGGSVESVDNSEMQAKLDEKDNEISVLNEKIEKAFNLLDINKQELDDLEVTLDDKEEEIAEKDKKIAELTEALNNSQSAGNADNSQAEAELAEKDKTITELKTQISNKENAIAEKDAAIAEKDKALEAKDKEIEELNMRLAKCDLSTSTKVAESILKTAEEGAQTITAEATVKADTIVADAKNKADELVKNAEDETAELRESNNKKAEELNVLADSIKNLLKDKLATLSDSFKAVNDAVSSAIASIDTANECIEDDEKLKEILPEYVPTLVKAEPAPEENIEAVEPIEEIEQEEVKSSLVTPELESILTDVAEQAEETPEVSQQEEEKEEIPPVANPLNFGMEGMEDLLKDIEASAPVDDEDDDIPLY